MPVIRQSCVYDRHAVTLPLMMVTRLRCSACPTRVPDLTLVCLRADCLDRFNNCRLVQQARLCRYKYYKTHCCETCSRV